MDFASALINILTLALMFTFFSFIHHVLAQASAVLALITFFGPVRNQLRKKFFNKILPSKNKAVLITGCDSGFGHLLAQRLYQKKFHVFAACLLPSGEGAEDLINRKSPKLQVLGLDVTNQQSVLDAVEFVKKNLQNDEELWAVVNNAGTAQAGEIEWTPMEEFLRVFDINTLGMIRVTKAFLPLLRKSKGRVVNNTSLNGKLTSPGYVGYCMSKTSAVSFTDGLRMEMVKWGVKVISVEPFFYKTPITGTERTLKLIENTFDEAPQDIKDAYGQEYLNGFKQSCTKLLGRSNPNVAEVLECFEDAITAEEPQQDYFPCYLPHKVVLKLWRLLPQSMVDTFQLSQAYSGKPAALCQ